MQQFYRTFFKSIRLNPPNLSTRQCVVHCDNTLIKQYRGKIMDGKTFKNTFENYYPAEEICKLAMNKDPIMYMFIKRSSESVY